MIVALICLLRLQYDKKYFIPVVILTANGLLVNYLVGFVFGLFFIVFVLFKPKLRNFLVGLFGFVLAFLVWFFPMILKYSVQGIKDHLGIGHQSLTNLVGTADYAGKSNYVLSNFFSINPIGNQINTMEGIGIVIAILCLVGLGFYLFFSKKEEKIGFVAGWFVLTMIGLNGSRLSFGILPFRWWTFLAIPVALLAGYGFVKLRENIKVKKSILIISQFLLLVLLLSTNMYPKLLMNGAIWGANPSLSIEGMLEGHIWMYGNLPTGTPIFSFYSYNKLQGFNMYSCEWCREEVDYRKKFMEVNPKELYGNMNRWGYDYLLLNVWYVVQLSEDANPKIQEVLDSGLFEVTYSNTNFILLKRVVVE